MGAGGGGAARATVPRVSPKAKASTTDARANVVERISFEARLARLLGTSVLLTCADLTGPTDFRPWALDPRPPRQVPAFSPQNGVGFPACREVLRSGSSATWVSAVAQHPRSGRMLRAVAVWALASGGLCGAGACAANPKPPLGDGGGKEGGVPTAAGAGATPSAGDTSDPRVVRSCFPAPRAPKSSSATRAACAAWARCTSPACAALQDGDPRSPDASSIRRRSTTSTPTTASRR